uniref:OV39 antigen n=2 Tax=Parascaris univalens TaxID=6257 RepID=A0A914ZVN8_PARUN
MTYIVFSVMQFLIVAAFLATLPAVVSTWGKRCGLPPFIAEMPAAEKQEVEAIWRDYKEGDDCEDRRERTKAVLDRLPPEIRDKIFHHIPPFLRGASDEVRKQFKDLWKNRSITIEEKAIKFRELANKLLNKQQLAEFKKFDEEHERMKKEFAEKVSKLSPKAKEAYEKLDSLRKERVKIYKEMSPEVREEIEQLFSTWPGKDSGSNSV